MRILAIETSCDETSVAIVEDGEKILSLQTAGQEEYHRAFGGVVPELAARQHLEVIYPTLEACLAKLPRAAGQQATHPSPSSSLKLSHSNLSQLQDLDAISVTTHPGLLSSLFVGVSTAKNLAYLLQKPLIAVSHLKAHFYSLALGSEISYPFIGLLVSGGHTILAEVTSPLQIEVIGTTLDDACGECFDKVARFLELPYPGGPAIEALAKTGDPFYFSYPIFRKKDPTHAYSFSYSGLKTAVLYNSHQYLSPKARQAHPPSQKSPSVQNQRSPTPAFPKEHIAASFQHAAFSQLVEKTAKAAYERGIHQIGICGGVAANAALKPLLMSHLEKYFSDSSRPMCFTPPLSLCTDNAAMIGGLAYHAYQRGEICEDLFALTPSAQSFKKHKIL